MHDKLEILLVEHRHLEQMLAKNGERLDRLHDTVCEMEKRLGQLCDDRRMR